MGKDRLKRIAALVDARGFVSVAELSQLLDVSEMTIRRDLDRLDEQQRLQRTYGGAASLRTNGAQEAETAETQPSGRSECFLVDRVDVLIASSVNPKYDGLLLERVGKKNIPIIAESLAIRNEETVVAVDNDQAGLALGRWAGEYAQRHFDGCAYVLDLGYVLSNVQARSRNFAAGLREILPTAEIVMSINAQSRYKTAYQLTRDALTVYKNINMIFAINDSIAWGAINACQDLNIDPEQMIVLPFGLEGDTLKNALMAGKYCKAGLAMFPEIVGPTCIEAAIAAYNHTPLPRQLMTPFTILTPETLPEFYSESQGHWQVRMDALLDRLSIPIDISQTNPYTPGTLPARIGFIVPFSEHEWYKNLIAAMQAYASAYGIEFEVLDADQNLKDELDIRRREIARLAAEQVQPGEVILIDGGPIANYLAESLSQKTNLTIITNSVSVFDILRQNPENILILTGGAFRHSSQMLVGPTAEGALRELRADKLFLTVTGISLNFGLSHTNISEVTIKQAMIRSAREVILLADHSFFGQESVSQVAPLTVVNRLITDDALPASVRLELTKIGLQIMLVDA